MEFHSQSFSSVSELGEIVREARAEQGLTQLDVAGLAGLSNRFIINLENGKTGFQMQKVIDVLSLLDLELVIRKR